jgi:hypothetical protein
MNPFSVIFVTASDVGRKCHQFIFLFSFLALMLLAVCCFYLLQGLGLFHSFTPPFCMFLGVVCVLCRLILIFSLYECFEFELLENYVSLRVI